MTKARSPARARLSACDAEPADHLHRGGPADPLEDGAGHVTEIVALAESGVGAPGVGLQVNTDASTPASSMRRATSTACAAGPWCGTMISAKASRGSSSRRA